MLHIKTRKQDLHKAIKSLKRLVAKRLKIRRHSEPEFEENFVRKQCLGKFTFKGDARSVEKLFEQRGFVATVGVVADQSRIRLTKTFSYKGKVYTARVTIYPDLQKLVIIAMAEHESTLTTL